MKKLKSILSSIFGVKEETITENSSPENIETWDSFNSLILISELEKNYSLRFTTEEIISVKNVGDIIKVLKEHKVSAKDI